nr:sec12-like protein 2 [Tanacetum cinerariifolium]
MSDGHVVHDAQHPEDGMLIFMQVEAGLLSFLIRLTLTERLENIDGDSCEWWPLKSFLHFLKNLTVKETCIFSPIDRKWALNDDDSFFNHLREFTSLAESERNPGKTTAFSSSMLSASPDLIANVYKGITPPDGLIYQKVFGGQIIRHARVNSLHGKFLVSVGSGPGRVWDISSLVAKASLPSAQEEILGF